MDGRQITHQICFDMLWSLTIIKERKNPNTMALKCEHVHIIFIKSSLFIGDLFSLKMARPPSPLKSISRIVVDCFCAPSMTHLTSFILFVVECWPTDYFIIDHAKETDFKAIIREYGQGCRKPSTRQRVVIFYGSYNDALKFCLSVIYISNIGMMTHLFL